MVEFVRNGVPDPGAGGPFIAVFRAPMDGELAFIVADDYPACLWTHWDGSVHQDVPCSDVWCPYCATQQKRRVVGWLRAYVTWRPQELALIHLPWHAAYAAASLAEAQRGLTGITLRLKRLRPDGRARVILTCDGDRRTKLARPTGGRIKDQVAGVYQRAGQQCPASCNFAWIAPFFAREDKR